MACTVRINTGMTIKLGASEDEFSHRLPVVQDIAENAAARLCGSILRHISMGSQNIHAF